MLKQPRGGELRNRYLEDTALDEARSLARHARSLDLASRQLCGLELLANGAFSPLQRLTGPAGYETVLKDMPLPGGLFWPIPVNRGLHLPVDRLASEGPPLGLSGAELRCRRAPGLDIPDRFTFPAVAAELRRACPSGRRQGLTVLFTGLSGAGKSTLANGLVAMLRASTGRKATLLDGDAVRKRLSSDLGFSRAHREINLRRTGFVAAEIAGNGGIAVCALIAPYAASRREFRETVEAVGGVLEVYVSTPLETCEARDRKGLYARARAGFVEGFTGIDDPFEAPQRPDIEIDTSDIAPGPAARRILETLESLGLIRHRARAAGFPSGVAAARSGTSAKGAATGADRVRTGGEKDGA